MVPSLYKTATRDFLTPKLISNLFNVFIRQDDLQILHPPNAKQQKPLATKENGQV
jgi:hypothetical protein